MDRLKLAVFKFASCDGCQLSLLSLEDELLRLADTLEIAYFLEARSQELAGPYDVGLVEGSVTTPHDAERIKEIRNTCRYLVTIGACATAGGIQALRNWADIDEFIGQVYAQPEYIKTLDRSTPIASHVNVDFELRGCPIDKGQLLAVLTDVVRGVPPRLPNYSVCVECKRQGTVCVAVTRNVMCLGPVTQAGCGALCPSYDRECFGCYGPKESSNLTSLSNHYLATRYDDPEEGSGDMIRLTRNFNGYSEPFRNVSNRIENSCANLPTSEESSRPDVASPTPKEDSGEGAVE